MLAIIFALITYIGWGTGDIFGAIVSRKIGAYSATIWVFIIGIVIFTFYIPFALHDLQKLTIPILALNAFLALFYVAGNTFYNEALKISNASIASTIAGSFGALTVIFSVLFLGESISQIQIVSIVTITIGVILASLHFSDLKKGIDRGVLYAILTMICWAVYFTFIKSVVKEIGWFWPNYISFWSFPIILLFMKVKKIKLEKPAFKHTLIPILLSALLLRSGDFAFNYGINNGLTAVVAPIAGAYPTLFAVIAFFVFKDPIKKQQFIGIIITLIGIVCLSFVSANG
jgi:drug/metabolite transporter (DMT)-like permease